MEHEKIISRSSGERIKIIVTIHFNPWLPYPEYDYRVLLCEPEQNIWKDAYNFDDDYKYRLLNRDDKAELRREKYLYIVNEQEINEALLELWKLLKPITKETDLSI